MPTPSQVNEAELEAISDLVRPPADDVARISTRSFKAPRRLSQAQFDALARRVDKCMADATLHLSSWLRSAHRVRVTDVVEAHVGVLIEGLVEPLRVLAFDVGSQLGFVAWDLGAMTAAIETALGSPDPKSAVARPLTPSEERVLTQMLSRVTALVTTSLGVEAKNFRVMREKKELILADDGTAFDPQRIGVHLALEGAAGESTLRIYVPGVKAPETANGSATAKDTKKNSMSSQMASVDVDLCAELGTVIIPLQELMNLEVGDVVVLETKVGDMVAITAEGEVRARGDLGRHDNKLAVRLRTLERIGSKSGIEK
ncbi:MAG: FliM/FliN family flagellar motor switch protein [Planctomycetes bacterium]|nr:FliM/FliN family flagellar motor switch protein [Planctomycetota bacterium]